MNPLNKILLGIGAALVAAVVICILWLALADAHLKTQLAQAQANGTACHLANDEFAARVAAQSRAVENLRQESVAHAMRARQAAARTQKTAQAYLAAAAALGKASAQGDACAAAGDLFDTYLKAQK